MLNGTAAVQAAAVLLAAAFMGVQFPQSSESTTITVPPGGYGWTVFSGELRGSDFSVVPTLSPGPWPSFRAILPPAADSAMQRCGEWLREDLRIRFSDLLYQDVDAGVPVVPRFSDVNGDGMEDLVLTDTAGLVLETLLSPAWEHSELEYLDGVTGRTVDITADGLPDSAFITGDGVLIMHSGSRPVLSADGFQLPAVSGTALCDMEGDGLADLVLGTESGSVLVIRNRGTATVPCFLPWRSDSRLLFPMKPGTFSSPAAVTDGYSVLSLAVGTGKDGLRLYTADISGDPLRPVWSDEPVTTADDGLLDISPVWAERNGEPLLVCGTRNGSLYGYVQGGDSLAPLSIPPVPGSCPSLTITDIDGDGSPDLVAGTMEGGVYFLPGDEGWFGGEWRQLEGLPDIPSGTPAPWEGGLVFGSEDGDIRYFVPEGPGSWREATDTSPFHQLYAGRFSAPAFSDIDGDGTEELIVGCSSGSLALYRIEDDAAGGGPMFLETYSWKFQPGGAVSKLGSYYSRYFPPFTVLRAPTGREMVESYSEEILRAEPRYRDEVAWCIANTPTEVLRSMYGNDDSDLFLVNAEALYRMADVLEYVTLTDSGGIGGCRLRTESGWHSFRPGDYYRFVVHPRILFEVPARVNAGYWTASRDTTVLSEEEWLNHEPDDLFGSSSAHVFWRDFLPSDSTSSGVLQKIMEEASTYEEAVVRLCNFQSHSQPNGRMSFGYATNDLQPMVIYEKAYGSCGEQSILQTALCRTFLIPAYVVGCRGEDHQWAHYLHPESGRWDHWDINYGIRGIGGIWVSGEGVDHLGKTISTITAFGPDNTVWPVTGSAIASPGSGYMPGDSGYTRTAQVEITVQDPSGRPVEGAMVLARSHWENANAVTQFEYTDGSGTCIFHLGWEPGGGYTIDIVSPFGSAGSGNVSFMEDMEYSIRYTIPCPMPRPQVAEVPPGSAAVDSAVTSLIYPVSYFAGSLYSLDEGSDAGITSRSWTRWRPMPEEGMVLYMNVENFRRYRSGLNCRALPRPFYPDPGDTCYAVLNNRESMFTWRDYHLDMFPTAHAQELSPEDAAWLNGPFEPRVPLVVPCAGTSDISYEQEGPGWATEFTDLQVRQDDPSDPLSAGIVIGPFRLPAGERSVCIETLGETDGMDLDLFLFRDSNRNLAVDGIEEMVSSSTTPTSAERIELGEADTTAAHWIFLQGWHVPGDSGKARVELSFAPEMLAFHSLSPTGYVHSMPEYCTFSLAEDTMEAGELLLAAGGDTIQPQRTGEVWAVARSLMTEQFRTGDVKVLTETREELGTMNWDIRLDSVPPQPVFVHFSVDSSRMRADVEVECLDALSGIRDVTLTPGSLSPVACGWSDSLWTCSLDLIPWSGASLDLDIILTDSAGNRTVEQRSLSIPDRPTVIFSHFYPRGTVYDHRPILQVYADFGEEPEYWVSSAVLEDSSGSFRLELQAMVVEGGLIQFQPSRTLTDGDYSVLVSLLDARGSLVGETAWEFRMNTMESTK